MRSQLERQIHELQFGEHLCMLYENFADQMAVVERFLKEGLQSGARCVYITDDRSSTNVIAALGATGINVLREQERGALVFLTKQDSYLRSGEFDPDRMIELLRRTLEQTLDGGFSGLRITGEMAWALEPENPGRRLIEYEAKLNRFFPGSRATGLCQYNRHRVPPTVIDDVLRTHPIAIVGKVTCQNLYYESPELVLDQVSVGQRVDWRINKLLRVQANQERLRESEDRYRDLAEHCRDFLCTHDLQGRILSVNEPPARLLGYRRDELLNKNIRDFLTDDRRDQFDAYIARIVKEGSANGLMRVQTASGEPRILEYHNTLRTEGVNAPIVRGMAHDITERYRAEKQAKVRIRQLVVVADLGRLALGGGDLTELIQQAVAAVQDGLKVEYVGVLELLPDGTALLLRAGVGWKAGCVGQTMVGAGTDSQAGYTLLSDQPVIVEDLRIERRFRGPALLIDHGVVSGMSTVIRGAGCPFGVLGAHSTQRRSFTEDDTHFLRAVANVLGTAIVQRSAEQMLHRSREQYRLLFESNPLPMFVVAIETLAFLDVNQAAVAKYGYAREEFLAMTVKDIRPPEDVPFVVDYFRNVLSGQRVGAQGSPPLLQHRKKDGSLIDVEITWSRITFAGADAVLAVAHDITERMRVERTHKALYNASVQIQEPIGLRERLDRVLQTAHDVLQLDRLNILLADREGEWLVGVASLGATEQLENLCVPISPEGGGLARAFLTQQMNDWDGRGPVPEALRLKPPIDRIEAFRSRVFANVPLIVQGQAIGVLGADRKRTRRPIETDTLELLQLFASQAAIAIQTARLFEQLQEGREQLQILSKRLVDVQEAERRHIARELHDEVGQVLTALQLNLEITARAVPKQARVSLSEAQRLVSELMSRARRLSLDLRPAMLDDLGLLPALLWFFERYAAQTKVGVISKHCGLEKRLAPEIETAAYRIVQEALTNIARHAGVNEATVGLWSDDDTLFVRVEDGGVGFSVESQWSNRSSSGLIGMRERAVLLGGTLIVESAPGKGTRVMAELPLRGQIERRDRSSNAR